MSLIECYAAFCFCLVYNTYVESFIEFSFESKNPYRNDKKKQQKKKQQNTHIFRPLVKLSSKKYVIFNVIICLY